MSLAHIDDKSDEIDYAVRHQLLHDFPDFPSRIGLTRLQWNKNLFKFYSKDHYTAQKHAP